MSDRIKEQPDGALVITLHSPIVSTDEVGSVHTHSTFTVRKITLGAVRRSLSPGGELNVLDLAAVITSPNLIDEIDNEADQDLLLDAVSQQQKKYQRKDGTTKG